MKKMIKRTASLLLALVLTLTMMPLLGQVAYAEGKSANIEGISFDLYDDINDGSGVGAGSVWITGYSGSNTQIDFPKKVTNEGVTFTTDTSYFEIKGNAFQGNKNITKIAIPTGYAGIGSRAFSDCTSLTEVSIGSLVDYSDNCGIGNDAFKGCTNLKTYNLDSTGMDNVYKINSDMLKDLKDQIKNSGIGRDSSDGYIAGVTVYTQEKSVIWQAITELNNTRPDGKKISLKHSDDPYGMNTVKPDSGSGSGGSSAGKETKGEDGTNIGKGASESLADRTIQAYKSEKDPKGSVFNLLQARLTKNTKTSLTLKWKKVPGAKKYIIYGNACGKKNKLKKQTTKTGTSYKVTKVNKKKLKKGTYYKFIVMAVNSKGKVISTSKIVHACTKGGKVGNDKKVKTKAKKNKVSVKKGKSFKLGAKPVAASKLLKVKRHRGISYESTNKKIAIVTSKGVIKGKKKGSCYVYAYAQNGVFAKIKVTVK